MGQNQGSPSSGQLINIPSLSKDLLDKLAHQTHYDKKEIKQLHTQFYSEVPNGAIPKEVGFLDHQFLILLW